MSTNVDLSLQFDFNLNSIQSNIKFKFGNVNLLLFLVDVQMSHCVYCALLPD